MPDEQTLGVEEAAPEEGALTTPAEPTVAQLATEFGQLRTGFGQLRTGFGQFAQELGSFLNDRLPPRESPASAPTARPSAKDLETRLLTDADGTLRENFEKNARETIAPTLQTVVDGRHEEIVATLQQDFDNEFGEGAWNEFVKPEFDTAVEHLARASYSTKASRPALQTMVNTIMGQKFKPLSEKQRETATRKRETPQMLTGGMRGTRSTAPRLNDEERAWLADYNDRTGAEVEGEQLLGIRKARNPDHGWTVDSIMAAIKGKGKAA